MAHPRQLERLRELLGTLPGIGPRQATRLAYALRDKEAAFLESLAATISSLPQELTTCVTCFRTMESMPHYTTCDICRADTRDKRLILVVEKEMDLEQFESAGTFTGTYHVLGGTISPLDKGSAEKLHLRELFDRARAHTSTETEVILATSNTLEGNQTANYVARILEPLTVRITRLGRGLSTGAEIEYADPQTLDQALKNRK